MTMNNTPQWVSKCISNIYGNKGTGRHAAVVTVQPTKVKLYMYAAAWSDKDTA